MRSMCGSGAPCKATKLGRGAGVRRAPARQVPSLRHGMTADAMAAAREADADNDNRTLHVVFEIGRFELAGQRGEATSAQPQVPQIRSAAPAAGAACSVLRPAALGDLPDNHFAGYPRIIDAYSGRRLLSSSLVVDEELSYS